MQEIGQLKAQLKEQEIAQLKDQLQLNAQEAISKFLFLLATECTRSKKNTQKARFLIKFAPIGRDIHSQLHGFSTWPALKTSHNVNC
jgi:hypothetical protein